MAAPSRPSAPFLIGLRVAAVALAVALGFLLYLRWQLGKHEGASAEPLPKFGQVGEFTLTGSDGQPYPSFALKGKIWAAQFFFTDCGGPCPAVTANLVQLQGMLGDAKDVRIVGVSIDPENDTPAKLREYAALHHTDMARWVLLTGPEPLIHDLVVKRLLLGFEKNADASATAATRMIHSTKVVLVDGTGTVRGYYEGLDAETPALLLSDIAKLMRQEHIK